MKIKVIIPNSGMNRETLTARESMLSRAVSRDTVISVDCIPSGPTGICSDTDEALASLDVIRGCIQAEKDGFDAVVIYCFSDLALGAVRENVRIPVIGPGEITMETAHRLSTRFTVITTLSSNIPRIRRRMYRMETGKHVSSVRALDITVEDLREDPNATKNRLKEVISQAIESEQIDGVVLGCLGMAEYGDEISREYGVNVYDPAMLSVAYAELCARNHLIPSPKAYPLYQRGKGPLPG